MTLFFLVWGGGRCWLGELTLLNGSSPLPLLVSLLLGFAVSVAW